MNVQQRTFFQRVHFLEKPKWRPSNILAHAVEDHMLRCCFRLVVVWNEHAFNAFPLVLVVRWCCCCCEMEASPKNEAAQVQFSIAKECATYAVCKRMCHVCKIQRRQCQWCIKDTIYSMYCTFLYYVLLTPQKFLQCKLVFSEIQSVGSIGTPRLFLYIFSLRLSVSQRLHFSTALSFSLRLHFSTALYSFSLRLSTAFLYGSVA